MYVIIVIIVILSCIIVMREFPLSHSPTTTYVYSLVGNESWMIHY